MQTEIMYDGHIAENRIHLLNKLAELVISDKIQSHIRKAEQAVIDKEAFKKYAQSNNIRSHIYFDIKVNGVVYPILCVGDYGIAIVGDVSNPLFNAHNRRVYSIEKAEDIVNLKEAWFGHPYDSYERLILDNQEQVTLADVSEKTYRIDPEVFVNSNLWKELDTRRSMLAESVRTDPYMIYKFNDVCDLLSTSAEISTLCPINLQYQQIIVDTWKSFLSGESGLCLY